MRTIKEATEFTKKFIKNHPEYKEKVLDLLQLCKDEIESGESEANEVSHFIESCIDLIEPEEVKN